MRKGDLVAAQRSFETYLAGQHLEKYQRSYAHYRLGQVASRRNNYGPAADHYAAAIKVDGHKGAKRALDRLKERRKEGGIEW